MDTIQRGVVTLIRSAITGQGHPLPADFRLEDAENLIIRHQIVGLVYEGALLCGMEKTAPAMRRLFQLYCQVVYRSNTQLAAVKTVTDAFEAQGIDYLPVKGAVLKNLYPNCAMRVMTDADILIRQEQRDDIRECMLSLGCKEKMISDHEWTWNSRDLCFELHTQLMPDFHIDHFHYDADGWKQAVHTGGHRYDLTAEEHYIYLFIHYAKHYRGQGIGLRQIVDLWVFRQAYPQLDMAYVETKIAQFRLTDFFHNTLRVLEHWFADGPADDITEHITRYIFLCGSWGTEAQLVVAEVAQRADGRHSMGYNKAGVLFSKLFPPAWIMKNQYPVLRKAPWLMPVFWPVRLIHIFLFRRYKIRKFRNQQALLNDENIASYQKALEYVGLR